MEKFVLKNLKGTQDFLPEEQMVRSNIMDILKSNFQKYGYLPIETPILNYRDLLEYKYADDAEILSEIYKLTDQADRKIGLRYDLTIPFCKVIGLNKNLTMPFRRYEIGKVFRNGPVKAGREREFYQCDVDVVGIDGRLVEVEQMQMVKNIFAELGIDILIKWNNRKFMCGLLEKLGYAPSMFDQIIGLIDRLQKISRAELLSEFAKLNVSEEQVDVLLNLFSKTLAEYQNMFAETNIQNLREGLAECVEIQNLVDRLNLNDNTQFSPTLARGLGIYTNTVFEFFDKKLRLTSSLGGGGRYNKIITDFMDNGQSYPAVGLSFGLEPIYVILKEEKRESFVDAYIVPMGTEIECLKLADELRNAGIKVLCELGGKKVKKAFEYANKTGVKYVMVVGSNELESGLYSLKNMQTAEQVSVSIEEAIAIIKNSK
jgi:histidyl-tRNA synthetase